MQPNKPVVLVVDDDPVNLDILVQTLEQDYFLIIAKNGKRALDLAFSHHPDLILLDILMPEMDGFEVCQRLKADKETEGIPVIFLSVMESPGQKHRVHSAFWPMQYSTVPQGAICTVFSSYTGAKRPLSSLTLRHLTKAMLAALPFSVWTSLGPHPA